VKRERKSGETGVDSGRIEGKGKRRENHIPTMANLDDPAT
jgi:hypothetical protein